MILELCMSVNVCTGRHVTVKLGVYRYGMLLPCRTAAPSRHSRASHQRRSSSSSSSHLCAISPAAGDHGRTTGAPYRQGH